LLERLVLAQHNLAIFKLERVGVARFRDGVNLGAPGELGEDGMEVGIAENAQVGHLEPEARQGIGHDRPVAAQLGQLADQFDVGAFARGGGQALRQLRDGWQPGVLLGALALVHHMEDVVHKAVQTDKRGHLTDARGADVQECS
jgi:hypothetical protein